jgi:cyanophycinase
MSIACRALIALFPLMLAAQATSAPVSPAPRHGLAVAIGGALKLDNTEVWNRLVLEAGGPGSRFAVFAIASDTPERGGERLADALRKAGAVAEVIPVAPKLKNVDWKTNRDDPAWIAKVAGMQGVFFSGGAQELITSTLQPNGQPTEMLKAIRQVFERGGVVAGTSAGAAIMSEWMFRDAQDTLAVLKGKLREGHEIDRGLGFVGPQLFIDQHFLKRGRIGRLLPIMQAKGYRWGLGVEENSAALIRNGHIEVIGARGALFVDLTGASRDPQAAGFSVKGALLTYLDRGDRHELLSNTTSPHPEKLAGNRIDPNSSAFKPFFKRANFYPDMLGDNTIVNAMAQLLDSPDRELKGLAFNGRALLERKAVDTVGQKDPDPTLGFEFRLYIGPQTQGQYTGAWGGEDYSVQRMLLDVLPVRLRSPLYEPALHSAAPAPSTTQTARVAAPAPR